MPFFSSRRLLVTVTVAASVALALSLAAVATSVAAARGTSRSSMHGTASVACAGSLVVLYHNTLGPAFKKTTGDNYGGPPCAGSLALAQDIISNEIDPGVFLAIGAKAIKELFPDKRAKFALAVAADPLVIGYSSKSRYFKQLNEIRKGKKPLSYLFKLFTTPGFRLGRTDPTQDPQGTFFILMTKIAERVLRLRNGEAEKALGITASKPFGSASQMYDEDALPTDIKEGIVDAGSEYLPEARQNGLDYITLPPALDFASPSELKLYSTVSLDVAGSVQQGEVIYLNVALVSPHKGTTLSAANSAADKAFVEFMLRPKARNDLERVGYILRPPVVHLVSGYTARRALPAPIYALYKKLGGTVSSS